MKRKLLVLLFTVALLTSPMVVSAAEVEPEFETVVSEPTLTPGAEQQVTIQIRNDAPEEEDFARAARQVEVEAQNSDSGIEVKSGTRLLGTLQDNDLASITVTIEVPADIPGGTHDIPLRVDYRDEGDDKTEFVDAEFRVDERPRFRIESTDSSVPVGGKGSVDVTMTNVGERAAFASAVSLTSTTPDVTFGSASSASRYVGRWKSGETRTVTYDVSVSEGAAVRNYSLSTQVEYEERGGTDGVSRSLRLGLRPLPEQTFQVENVESTFRVGQQGTLSGEIVNTGSLTVQNAVVTFQANSPSVTTGENEYAVGTLEPGDSAEFSFDATLDDSANAGPRQFSLSVNYRNDDDDQLSSAPIDVQAEVGPQQPDFEVQNVESTLRVGEEGTISGEILNTDDSQVTNAVVIFESTSPTVTPVETEYAVGTLGPGESAAFAFDTEISQSADAGPRQFTFRVRYRNTDNVQRTTDQLEVQTEVAEQSPEFDVEPVDATVAAGSGGELRLEVTNTREEVLTDISAKIYAESPLSTSDDEAFIERLEPGETREIVFDVSAGGSALEKTYPMKLDFRYDDSEGDTVISDTYQLPIEVTEQSGGGLPVPVIVGALVVVAAGGYVVYRRRQDGE